MIARAVLTLLLLASAAAHAEISISAHQTKNMVCSDGVCAPTAKSAYLNVHDLEDLLKSSDIKVTTGAGTVTIDVDVPLDWSSSSRLTLDATSRVEIKAPISVVGKGKLTLLYNDGGSGGYRLFFNGAKINFSNLKSDLTINGKGFTLVSDIASLAVEVDANAVGNYALANDYDARLDGTYNNYAIPPFAGSFEGLGHTISNLMVSGSLDYTGFFLSLSGARVTDFDLSNANVLGFDAAGILAGTADADSFIEACSSSGFVKSRGEAGGLVGLSFFSTVRRSHSAATVRAHYSAGGLVGSLLSDAVVDGSYATGSVSATSAGGTPGGLIGYNSGGSISNSYATGPVHSRAGGSRTPRKDKIPDAGGLVGWSSGTATSSYSLGAVSGSGNIGGFVGYDNAGNFGNAYWNLDTSGISDPSKGAGNIPDVPGITGLTDAQLKSGLPDGFDPKIWGSDPNINTGYPYLRANPPQ